MHQRKKWIRWTHLHVLTRHDKLVRAKYKKIYWNWQVENACARARTARQLGWTHAKQSFPVTRSGFWLGIKNWKRTLQPEDARIGRSINYRIIVVQCDFSLYYSFIGLIEKTRLNFNTQRRICIIGILRYLYLAYLENRNRFDT